MVLMSQFANKLKKTRKKKFIKKKERVLSRGSRKKKSAFSIGLKFKAGTKTSTTCQ